MPDLPDWFTQVSLLEAEAYSIRGGADAAKPASPEAKDVYLATDTDKLYYSIADGAWRGYFVSSPTFDTHHARHENGGADEISVTGLSGLLADGQTPIAHKTSHQDGGTDEISIAGLAGEPAELTAHKALTTGVHGVGAGAIVGTTLSQTLTNKTIDADNNTISNLAHGAEVDNPTSGVHGATGTIVGTSDSQTLTNKTLTSPTIQGTVGAGTGLTMPAFTLSGTVALGGQVFNAGAVDAEIDTTGSDKGLLIKSTQNDNLGVTLTLKHDSATPAVSDYIARIVAIGKNDAGEEIEYGYLQFILQDETDGTEDARFRLRLIRGGSVTTVMQWYENANAWMAGNLDLEAGQTVDGRDVSELSQVIWKDASENALTSANVTADVAFTDLDLTAYTSAAAKIAILRLRVTVDSQGSEGVFSLSVRKNGTTPTYVPNIYFRYDQLTAGDFWHAIVFCGMDDDEVIEYELEVCNNTGQADFYIDVLGYIE